jgi:hypothetical protein
LLLFQTGSLAPDVTVRKATYQLTAADAGVKYRGFWAQGEGSYRKLDNFPADGPLPLATIRDFGFYFQTSYMVVPKTVELYGATSYIFSPMGGSHEFVQGANYYIGDVRNYRVNFR